MKIWLRCFTAAMICFLDLSVSWNSDSAQRASHGVETGLNHHFFDFIFDELDEMSDCEVYYLYI
jgi:hypothetical protein